jgi:4-diphosphocytidyl-2-C-methyl-D-erythritol kinase
VLRWAGVSDPAVACALGADVPFCMVGGRALVTGVGEVVGPMEFEARAFVLLTPPFGVSTAAVYRAWDEMGGPAGDGANDLEAPALAVEPRLARWRGALGDLTGRVPVLAGSGSTWFVEGSAAEMGVRAGTPIEVDGGVARLVEVRTERLPGKDL